MSSGAIASSAGRFASRYASRCWFARVAIASSAALEGRDFSGEAEELGAATGRMHRQLAEVMGTIKSDEQERRARQQHEEEMTYN